MKQIKDAIPMKQREKMNRELDKEFMEALEDPVFKEIVEKLNMDPDILKTYTSSLQDSRVE